MKKKVKKILGIIVLSLGLINFSILPQSPIRLQHKASSPTWDVYFSPRGGATYAIRQALDNAKSVVLVQACSFASGPNHC